MAIHPSSAPILPFPESIDRTYLAAFLSGFTAGEGYFSLSWDDRHSVGRAKFGIDVRQDEYPTIQLIQSFLTCGFIYFRGTRGSSNPGVQFTVFNLVDLSNIVIPHFERHPILAKKNRDFQIWREAVRFLLRKKEDHLFNRKMKKTRSVGQTWSEQDRSTFRQLVDALRECRRYKTEEEPIRPAIEPPQLKRDERQNLLF
jgi:hypothetical protein